MQYFVKNESVADQLLKVEGGGSENNFLSNFIVFKKVVVGGGGSGGLLPSPFSSMNPAIFH